jgi:hypothetical protein
MKLNKFTTSQVSTIHLAFNPSTLESLIREGKLHASDFNCMDKVSKRGVWAVMRSVAASTIRLT